MLFHTSGITADTMEELERGKVIYSKINITFNCQFDRFYSHLVKESQKGLFRNVYISMGEFIIRSCCSFVIGKLCFYFCFYKSYFHSHCHTQLLTFLFNFFRYKANRSSHGIGIY